MKPSEVNPMKYKLLLLDIDGTLRPGSCERVPRENAEAVCAVQKAGVKIAIATGRGRIGVLHGSKSYVLCGTGEGDVGQIAEAHSISAGLDYPGVGPEHAHWRDSGRATYVARTDAQALAGLERLARTEGILCALETAHAVAALDEVATMVGVDGVIILGLSGRGDKDMVTVAKALEARTVRS